MILRFGYAAARQTLVEGGEFYQVIVGDAFDWLAGFAPGAEASGYYEHFESQLL